MAASPDPGLVGISLNLKASTFPEALIGELPFELLFEKSRSPKGGVPEDGPGEVLIGLAIGIDDGIDAAITELANAVSELSGAARQQWASLVERYLDLGLTNRPEMAACRFVLRPESISAMSTIGLALVITWYWPQAAYETDPDLD